MSVFDNLFDKDFLFDSEYKQRRDIKGLQDELDRATDPRPMLQLQKRLDSLELLCKALAELVVSKGVATVEELSVITQQLDLADGVEDGKVSPRARQGAPRCSACNRYLNPRRTHCVYCNAQASATDANQKAPERTATCGKCGNHVPESQTFYTGDGLRCTNCYDPNDL